jgi:hypothetical protein
MLKYGKFNFGLHLCNTTTTSHKGQPYNFSRIINKGQYSKNFTQHTRQLFIISNINLKHFYMTNIN